MDEINTFLNNKTNEMIHLEEILTSTVALSPENGGDGEYEKCEVLLKWLKENGFSNIQRIDAPDSRVSKKVRPSLIVTIPGISDAYNIWVMTHLDVVPSGDLSLWKTNPWQAIQKDGIIYGRGVEDNQQGLVSSVFASLYFIQNNIKPLHTIKLLFVADEECGSEYGISYILKNYDLFSKKDFILIPDGGDKDGVTIEIAEKNLLWLCFHVIGKQTHGSRPDSGNNACLAACDLTLKINNLEKVFDKKDSLFEPSYSTFQPTKRLKNVDGVNIIPGEDTFFMDCRILPCYKLSSVLEKVNELCKETELKYGVKIELSIPQQSESPATPNDSPVVIQLSKAIKKAHGLEAQCIGIGGGTVGAELRRKGFNAAVWSTLDDQAHQPNEYCKIENIKKDALTLAVLFQE